MCPNPYSNPSATLVPFIKRGHHVYAIFWLNLLIYFQIQISLR